MMSIGTWLLILSGYCYGYVFNNEKASDDKIVNTFLIALLLEIIGY